MTDATIPTFFYLVKTAEEISILESHDDPLDVLAQGIHWIDRPLFTRVDAEQHKICSVRIMRCLIATSCFAFN
jgi:hypothetical protein